jgi:uncharacterized protein (DUF2147 family)
MKYFLTLSLLLISMLAYAQNIEGKWQTIDEESGKPKAIVQIYQKDGQFQGQIIKILDPEAPEDATCRDCPGDKAGKPIKGLIILEGLTKDGKKYDNGEILDPENGKTYDCKVWLNEDNPDLLMVRGYLLFLYRTQTWERVG